MARGLAEAGADIIILQVPGEKSGFPEQLSLETRRNVAVCDCDLGDNAMIRNTVAENVERDTRTVDILCNCAGISGGFIPVLDETDTHRELASPKSHLKQCVSLMKHQR